MGEPAGRRREGMVEGGRGVYGIGDGDVEGVYGREMSRDVLSSVCDGVCVWRRTSSALSSANFASRILEGEKSSVVAEYACSAFGSASMVGECVMRWIWRCDFGAVGVVMIYVDIASSESESESESGSESVSFDSPLPIFPTVLGTLGLELDVEDSSF